MGYEVVKYGERAWGLTYRVSATISFDQRVRFKTRRAAISAKRVAEAIDKAKEQS